jgi:hypothetical protein
MAADSTCSFGYIVACYPLLRIDRKISSYGTTVARQPLVNVNKGTVFSVQSVPRCYEQSLLFCRFSRLVIQLASELPNWG